MRIQRIGPTLAAVILATTMLYGGLAVLVASLVALVDATTIAEIKGTSFLSPLVGKVVYDVTGVVVAKVSTALPSTP